MKCGYCKGNIYFFQFYITQDSKEFHEKCWRKYDLEIRQQSIKSIKNNEEEK